MKRLTLDEKWAVVERHYAKCHVRFKKRPPEESVLALYKDLMTFENTYLQLITERPELEERTLQSAGLKKIPAPEPKIKIVQ